MIDPNDIIPGLKKIARTSGGSNIIVNWPNVFWRQPDNNWYVLQGYGEPEIVTNPDTIQELNSLVVWRRVKIWGGLLAATVTIAAVTFAMIDENNNGTGLPESSRVILPDSFKCFGKSSNQK